MLLTYLQLCPQWSYTTRGKNNHPHSIYQYLSKHFFWGNSTFLNFKLNDRIYLLTPFLKKILFQFNFQLVFAVFQSISIYYSIPNPVSIKLWFAWWITNEFPVYGGERGGTAPRSSAKSTHKPKETKRQKSHGITINVWRIPQNHIFIHLQHHLDQKYPWFSHWRVNIL